MPGSKLGPRQQATGTTAPPPPEHPSPGCLPEPGPLVQTDCRPSTTSAGLEPDAGGSSGLLTGWRERQSCKGWPWEAGCGDLGGQGAGRSTTIPTQVLTKQVRRQQRGCRHTGTPGVCPSASGTVPTAGSSLSRARRPSWTWGHTAFSFPDLPDSHSCRPSDDRSYWVVFLPDGFMSKTG